MAKEQTYSLKLFIEPTTRCNLKCKMCLKQSPYSDIKEGDLSRDLFNRLIPAIAKANAIILTGIGEPLLHPDLELFIKISKKHLPENGWVGFQTNGLLLDDERIKSLIHSGVDRICISIDSLNDEVYQSLRIGSHLERIKKALINLNRIKRLKNTVKPEIGIEFVLMKDNFHNLESLINWSDSMGVSFIIVSHLLPYCHDFKDLVVFNTNSDKCRKFFEKWMIQANKNEIKLPDNDLDYYDLCWSSLLPSSQKEIALFLRKVERDAYRNNISLNLLNLLKENSQEEMKIRATFSKAEQMAAEKGIDLSLPTLRPKMERYCRFIEENSMFVSWYGSIHPCYFLWHKYSYFRSGTLKHVNPVTFGSVQDSDILDIWNDPAFIKFKHTVKGYDYPYCNNCNIGPCPLVSSEEFDHDCYLTDVPCGDCYWNSGILSCMQ